MTQEVTPKNQTSVFRFYFVAFASVMILLFIWLIPRNREKIGSVKDNIGIEKAEVYIDIKEINPNNNTALIHEMIFKVKKDAIDSSKIRNGLDLLIYSGELKFNKGIPPLSPFHEKYLKLRPNYFGDEWILKVEESLVISLSENKKFNLFPFDSYIMELSFILTDVSGTCYYPSIYTKFSDERIMATKPTASYTSDTYKSRKVGSFKLEFYRSVHQKIIFILVILAAFITSIWSMGRILFSNDSNISSFGIIGLNISIVLTLTDLKQLIVPENIHSAAIFEISATIIWFLCILTILIFIFNQLRVEKLIQFEKENHDNKFLSYLVLKLLTARNQIVNRFKKVFQAIKSRITNLRSKNKNTQQK